MNSELLKVFILPAVLAGTMALVVLTGQHSMPRSAIWLLLAGWLVASLGLTVVGRESQPWPLAGYLQNFVAFLGLCAVPFVVAYGLSTWLEARGVAPATRLGVTLILALLAILPGFLVGPYWWLFLRSAFGWQYIRFP